MTDEPFAKFIYVISDGKGSVIPYESIISLTTTPCNLGGKRYWFIDLAKEKDRKQFISKLCEKYPRLTEQKGEIHAHLFKELSNCLKQKDSSNGDNNAVKPLELSEKALAETDDDIIEQAKALLRQPQLIDCILEHMTRMGIVGERSLALSCYLTHA